MALEKEMMQVAMNGEGVVERRHFLQTIWLGAWAWAHRRRSR